MKRSRKFWSAIFNDETVQNFINNDCSVLGFRTGTRIKNVQKGDLFIGRVNSCESSGWFYIGQALESYHTDSSPYFLNEKDPFYYRVKVKTLFLGDYKNPVQDNNVGVGLNFLEFYKYGGCAQINRTNARTMIKHIKKIKRFVSAKQSNLELQDTFNLETTLQNQNIVPIAPDLKIKRRKYSPKNKSSELCLKFSLKVQKNLAIAAVTKSPYLTMLQEVIKYFSSYSAKWDRDEFTDGHDDATFGGYSKNAFQYISDNGSTDGLRREHIVPVVVLRDLLCDLICEEDKITLFQLISIIKQYNVMIFVTKEEQCILDKKFKESMPDGWEIGGDPLARLKEVDIKVE